MILKNCKTNYRISGSALQYRNCHLTARKHLVFFFSGTKETGGRKKIHNMNLPGNKLCIPTDYTSKLRSDHTSYYYNSRASNDTNLNQDCATDQPNKCPFCLITTHTRTLLQRHMSTNHSEQLPFSCSLCSRGFYTQSGLQRHIKDHEAASFSCMYCDLQLKRKQYLVKHLKAVHKLLPCLYCSSTFSMQQELNQHLLNCGKKF